MTTAKQVPAEVAALDDYLRGTTYHTFAGRFMQSLLAARGARDNDANRQVRAANPESMGRRWAEQERNFLRISQLFHVTEPMLAVAMSAAQTIWPSEKWNREALPAMHGVLFFEQPLVMADIWNRNMTARLIAWHRDEVPGTGEWGTRFTIYADAEDNRDAYSKLANMEGHKVIETMGRSVLGHIEVMVDDLTVGAWDTYDSPSYRDRVSKYRSTHRRELASTNYQNAADDDFDRSTDHVVQQRLQLGLRDLRPDGSDRVRVVGGDRQADGPTQSPQARDTGPGHGDPAPAGGAVG